MTLSQNVPTVTVTVSLHRLDNHARHIPTSVSLMIKIIEMISQLLISQQTESNRLKYRFDSLFMSSIKQKASQIVRVCCFCFMSLSTEYLSLNKTIHLTTSFRALCLFFTVCLVYKMSKITRRFYSFIDNDNPSLQHCVKKEPSLSLFKHMCSNTNTCAISHHQRAINQQKTSRGVQMSAGKKRRDGDTVYHNINYLSPLKSSTDY